MKALPEEPLNLRDIGGCTCHYSDSEYGHYINEDGSVTWKIDPECKYHKAAAQQPWNHHIPWNCPTFWDGCNCDGGPYFP